MSGPRQSRRRVYGYYLLKVGWEALMTPFTFDRDTNFTPFTLGT